MAGLFSLEVERPNDTETIKYQTIGATLGKKKFYQFLNEVEKSMNVALDSAVYSRMIIEVSKIDGNDYYELSLNDNIFLPIAGRQSEIVKRHANEHDFSLEGFVESINFVLNDSRIYN